MLTQYDRWQVPVSLGLPQVRWVCAPSPPCHSPSPRTHSWPSLTFSLYQKQNMIYLSRGEGYRLRICRGPGPFLSPEMIRNPIAFYASRAHQRPGRFNTITSKQLWDTDNLALTLTARWLSAGFGVTPTAPMSPSKPPVLLCGWLSWKPVVSARAVTPHRLWSM